MPLHTLTNAYQEIFNSAPASTFFAPGRVNLIGEHIDYNGGLVFPCAITKGTYGAVSPRQDNAFHLYSANFKDFGQTTLDLNNLDFASKDNWTNYVKGVLSILIKRGYDIPFGLNIAVYGDLPNGAGLSSSASLEMLMCKIFDTYYHLELTPEEMALIGKQVENEYISVNSGIMDQFAVALGKPDCALLLNCASQKYNYIPFHMQGYELVIMNTNKRRELADSKYNERFSECQTALNLLKEKYDIQNLCSLKTAQLKEIEAADILNTVLFKRVKHVVTENERVLTATAALREDNLGEFGKLLYGSHHSLQYDYEVTGKELDTLVDAARESGATGARMTGAGFGGCAIALVKSDLVDSFIEKVSNVYEEIIGYKASFYKATVGNGPIQLS